MKRHENHFMGINPFTTSGFLPYTDSDRKQCLRKEAIDIALGLSVLTINLYIMKKKIINHLKIEYMIMMKKSGSLRHFLMAVLMLIIVSIVHGQAPATPATLDTSKMSYNQISNGIGLFVFPSKGQTNQQQKIDEFTCYQWAIQQSGIDPLNMPAAAPVQQQSGPTGAAVVGSAKGAAAGAAIGSISGDMGKGAAYGAIIGGVAGRRQGKAAQQQANAQAQNQAKAQDKEMHDKFQRAFSVCMEGKGYTLK